MTDPNGTYTTSDCNNQCGGGAAKKYIFTTTTHYTGNLGGIAGADTICNNTATAAGLGGTWKAWLSDSNTNAIDRINDVGPWYLLNGVKAFNNKVNLTTAPLVALNVNENGETFDNDVWTGTNVGGTKSGDNCYEWWGGEDAGTYGDNRDPSIWTDRGGPANWIWCTNGFPSLYCIEQ